MICSQYQYVPMARKRPKAPSEKRIKSWASRCTYLFRVSWDNPFSWTILWMLWTLPNFAPSTAHYTVFCAIIHLTNWNLLKRRSFINISQISFAFWVSAAYFHCLEIPTKVLSALVHNLNWKTTIGASSGSPVLIRGSLSDMFSMQKFKTLLCIFRGVYPMNNFSAATVA